VYWLARRELLSGRGAMFASYDCQSVVAVAGAMLRRKCGRPCRWWAWSSRRPVGGRLAAAGRSVSRKYRKASIRRLQQQEYDKLCRIVPALATRPHRRRIAKVTVTSAPHHPPLAYSARCLGAQLRKLKILSHRIRRGTAR